MCSAARTDRLADRRIVTVLVRVVLDRRGRLTHGEVLDARGQVRARFLRWTALMRAIRAQVAHRA